MSNLKLIEEGLNEYLDITLAINNCEEIHQLAELDMRIHSFEKEYTPFKLDFHGKSIHYLCSDLYLRSHLRVDKINLTYKTNKK